MSSVTSPRQHTPRLSILYTPEETVHLYTIISTGVTYIVSSAIWIHSVSEVFPLMLQLHLIYQRDQQHLNQVHPEVLTTFHLHYYQVC